jgi:putative transposase
MWYNIAMKYRKQSHCVYYCEYHLVFATKYRRKIFNDGIFAYMKDRLKQVKDYYPEIDILKINHDVDHIHVLVVIPPKFSVSQVVRIIKSNTSKDLKKKFPFLKDVYWGTDGIWSDGYFVSTVGINETIIARYIENQGKEDSGQAQLVLSRRLT